MPSHAKLTIVVISLVTAASNVSYAGDAAWLWCKGTADRGIKPNVVTTYFAASLLEHRAGRSDGGLSTRELSVTLVYGDHVGRGVIREADVDHVAGPLEVRNIEGKHAITFTGTGDLAFDLTTFTLKGKIDFSFGFDAKPTREPFVATMSCQQLDDLAIGH